MTQTSVCYFLSHTHTQKSKGEWQLMKMGSHLAADEEEDYINMELTSSPQLKEFEFQFFSASAAKESAADELFYKGKLLPLHLPPRRQMVEHLLRTSTAAAFPSCSTAPCTNSNTPSDSCNISPSESCRVSCDLNPNDEWPTQFFNNHLPTSNTSSWSTKLKMKLINRSFLAHKLKSFKSFFTKSDAQNLSSRADAVKYSRFGKKFSALIKKNGIDDHRRSFSGAIAADFSTTTSSSSSTASTSTSSSFNSSGLHELQFLQRSSSAAEIEVSIDAAIAHCKKSMQTSNWD